MDVYYLPNKSCGYAKYADQNSAYEAMETLNGADICGIRMKVYLMYITTLKCLLIKSNINIYLTFNN